MTPASPRLVHHLLGRSLSSRHSQPEPHGHEDAGQIGAVARASENNWHQISSPVKMRAQVLFLDRLRGMCEKVPAAAIPIPIGLTTRSFDRTPRLPKAHR